MFSGHWKCIRHRCSKPHSPNANHAASATPLAPRLEPMRRVQWPSAFQQIPHLEKVTGAANLAQFVVYQL